ncbi:MAG: class F sortase [Chloroflexi bacterium]|nr:class F sortase [Chloroflexota bacterium]
MSRATVLRLTSASLIFSGLALLLVIFGLFGYSKLRAWQMSKEAVRAVSVAAGSLAPQRIVIPSLGVDSRVVEVGIQGGEYEVQAFAVGHYEDSANPGQPGNMLLWGHVDSLNLGNVFANLGLLAEGDPLYLQSGREWYKYVVQRKQAVPRDRVDVLGGSQEPIATLVACTGGWDWTIRDYPERLIVTAALTEVGSAP